VMKMRRDPRRSTKGEHDLPLRIFALRTRTSRRAAFCANRPGSP
jgi:hypothetical protein